MLAEHAPLLVLDVDVPDLFEQRERLRLILKILENRQLARFARPVDEINFFRRVD